MSKKSEVKDKPVDDEQESVYVDIPRKSGMERMKFYNRVKPEKGPGRPAFVLTKEARRYITAEVARGRSIEGIAVDLNLNERTFYSHANREFLQEAKKRGDIKRHDNIRVRQLEKAIDEGDTNMLKWVGIQELGQSDQPQQLEVPVSPIPAYITKLLEGVRRGQ